MDSIQKKRRHEIVKSLYAQHHDLIFGYFRIKTSNIESAHELTQETFLRILDKGAIDTIHPDKHKSYLQKSAHNQLIDYYRTEKRKEEMIKILIHDHQEINETCDNQETIFIQKQLYNKILHYLDTLTPMEHTVFHHRIYDNKTISDICTQENITRYHAQRILDTITSRIREEISKYNT